MKAAMRQWATGVCVVTAAHDGVIHGLTVSGFMSVSLTPPVIAVCVNEVSRANQMIAASGLFAVNVLAAHQRDISDRFAGRHPSSLPRFDGVSYVLGQLSGCPLLAETVAVLECRSRQVLSAVDHLLYLGEVVGTRSAERDPLLYFRGDYREMIFGRRGNVRGT
jgi:flavin reductase